MKETNPNAGLTPDPGHREEGPEKQDAPTQAGRATGQLERGPRSEAPKNENGRKEMDKDQKTGHHQNGSAGIRYRRRRSTGSLRA